MKRTSRLTSPRKESCRTVRGSGGGRLKITWEHAARTSSKARRPTAVIPLPVFWRGVSGRCSGNESGTAEVKFAFVSLEGDKGVFSLGRNVPLRCPNCETEMEQGWLYGKPPLLWSPRKKKVVLLRRQDEVHILDGAFPTAHICKNCRKVVIDY